MSLLDSVLGLGKRRFILTVGEDGAILTYVVGNAVKVRAMAPSTAPEDVEPFLEVLAEDRKAPIRVLLDVLDQSYRQEDVPVGNPMDGPKILRRKLEMTFPGDVLRGALKLGKEGAGRTAKRHYLFCAVPQNGQLESWIEFVQGLPNPKRGLALLPLEAGEMTRKLVKAANLDADAAPAGSRPHWRMLLSRHRTGGFRQVVLKNDQMIFTRLTQGLPFDAPPEDIAHAIAREFRMTATYLKRLGYLPEDRLDLVLLTSAEVAEAAAEQDMPATELLAISPHKAADLLGFSGVADPEDDFADVLHAVWVASRPRPVLSLQPASMKVDFVGTYGLRTATAVGTVAFLLAMGDVATRYPELKDLEGSIETMKLNRLAAEQRLKEARERLGEFPVPAERVTAVLDARQSLIDAAADVPGFVGTLSPLLGAEGRVERFSVQVSNSVLGRLSGGGEERRRGGGEEASGSQGLSATLEVSLARAADDMIRAVHDADTLLDRLSEGLPDHRVELVSPPVNLRPDQLMTLEAGRIRALQDDAEEEYSAVYRIAETS